jgi:hypothetical protein
MKDEQLNRQLRVMVDGAAAPLSQAEVVLRASSPARKSRRDWYLTEHRLIVVAVAAAIVVVFFVPLPSLSLFNRLSHTGISSNQSPAATIPADWVPVTLGDARISVPASWWVRYNSPDCPRGKEPGEVLVNPTPTGCSLPPPGDVPKNVIELYSFYGHHYGHLQVINGITVYWSGGNVYEVPSLGTAMAIQGPLGGRVLHTLTRSPEGRNTTTTVPKPLPVVDLSATPAGWVPVTFGDAQVSVPPGFPVAYPGQTSFCKGASASGPGGLLVDIPPGETVHCAVERHPTMVYWASVPLPSSVAFEHIQKKSILLNGVRVHRIPTAVTYFGYYAPSLGVQVIAQGPLAKRILGTLTRSPRSVALASGPAPAVPSSWQRLRFQGLAFAAPGKWPVLYTLSDYPFGWICGAGTLNHGPLPVVNLSYDKSLATMCWEEQSQLLTPQSPQDGLQIDSGPRTLSLDPVKPSFSEHCLSMHDLTVCPATSPAYSVLVLKVTVSGRTQPVIVSIGLAGNGMIARTILHSLRAGTSVAPRFQKFERATTSAMSLPGTIPPGGVALMGDELVDGTHPTLLYLDPATAVTGMMSKAQAEHDALRYDNAAGLRATGAVLATVTAPSDVPPAGVAPPSSATIGTVAWVVEVTPPSPIAENDCLPTGPTTGAACTSYVSHDYVVLDPTTGAFRISLS